MEDLQRSIGYYICYEHLFSTWTKPDSGFSVSTLSEALKKFNRLLHKRFLHISTRSKRDSRNWVQTHHRRQGLSRSSSS